MAYFLNGRKVTRKQFILPATCLSILLLATLALGIGAFCYVIASLWEHNLTGAFIGAGILMVMRVLKLREKPIKFTLTAGSLVRLAGNVLLIAGIWHHSPLLIIAGILIFIRFTFSTK